MQRIIFISTMHKEIGKCKAEELYTIIERIKPEVIFLEALNDTYSDHDKFNFIQFGLFHKKLEIKTIQLYNGISAFNYIPVLDTGLSKNFDIKYTLLRENFEFQQIVNKFNDLAGMYGFQFLNSEKSIQLQDEMRAQEELLLKNYEINRIVAEEIDAYEDSMIRNISSYCVNNQFDTAIFMCGVAHRKSIINKVKNLEIKLNWVTFEG